MTDEFTVEELTPVKEDVDAAASVLALAYHDTPTMKLIFEHEGGNGSPSAVEDAFRVFVATYAEHQLVWGIRDQGTLVAVMLGDITSGSEIPIMGWRPSLALMRAVGTKTAINFRSIVGNISKYQMHGTLHYHVFALGVHPEHRRKGLGRRLMERVAWNSDRARIAYTCEADSEAAVEFFMSVGCVISQRRYLTREKNCVYLMLRPEKWERE